jgi:hypothetical protein
MLRLVRLAVLLLVAFVTGVFYERGHQQELCANSGGEWMRAGFCAAR